MKLNGKLILFTAILVALTSACKFFFGPDLNWSGFSPVIAIALFSGFIIKQRDISFLLPLLALFLSDLCIQLLFKGGAFPYAGFYDGQWKNYLILLVSTLIGWGLKGRNYSSLIVGAIAAPTVFFLASNLAVWMGAQTSYAKDFNGLINCYTAALPFYKNSLIATFIFLPAILLCYNYMMRQKVELRLA
jgi:hypothetical protein